MSDEASRIRHPEVEPTMFGDIGVPELLIILALVMVLFGAGRVGRLGKDLGTAVKDFRAAIRDEPPTEATGAQPPLVEPPASSGGPMPPTSTGASQERRQTPAIF
jgi:sec-independent protein translocase protein TatA